MCVAFFTLEHPDYALVLCSNRDEYLSRPTQPARFHTFDGHILSGIDVQAGGTWLGLSRTGKLALLTNITEQSRPFASSRGHLVSSFLSSPASSHALQDDVERLIPPDARYAGFNLVLFSTASPPPHLSFDALYVTNHGAAGPITYRTLSDTQRHCALSNGIDGNGADEWPKVQHGIHAFKTLLDTLPPNTSEDQLSERLFDLLTWVQLAATPSLFRSQHHGWRSSQLPADRSELRNTIQVDPIHFGNEPYATRLSTVVLVKKNGHVLFIERDRWTLSTQGQPILADPSSQRVFRFRLEGSGLST